MSETAKKNVWARASVQRHRRDRNRNGGKMKAVQARATSGPVPPFDLARPVADGLAVHHPPDHSDHVRTRERLTSIVHAVAARN